MIAFKAVLIAARGALVSEGSWDGRVYRDMAPNGASLPYVVMTYVGGGTRYEHQGRPKNVRMRFIVYGSTQSESDAGADTVETTLADKGTQEVSSGALDASANGWEIVLARALDDFQPPAELDENREIYRSGLDIDFKCERTS